MTHTIKNDVTVNTPTNGTGDPPKRWDLLITDATLALFIAIIIYVFLDIFVYIGALPPWTPRAAAVTIGGLAFLVLLCTQGEVIEHPYVRDITNKRSMCPGHRGLMSGTQGRCVRDTTW